MSLQEISSSSNRRKPRGLKKSTSLIETTALLRNVRVEVHPPLASGTTQTMDIREGTVGIISGPAPDGIDGFEAVFELGRHHSITAVVARGDVARL